VKKNKIVSSIEGYTFFIDEKKCFDFETGKHLTGQEIANILNISRVAVSQNLKKGLTKIYKFLRKRNTYLDPVDVVLLMADMFGIKSETQYNNFFKLFNNKIKGEIYKNAKKEFRS